MSRRTGSGLNQAEHHLVASGLLSPGEIDEAIARQLIFGGELSTSALEISAITETQLEAVLAEAAAIAPLGPGPIRLLAEDSRRLHAHSIPALALRPNSGSGPRPLLVTAPLDQSDQKAAEAILEAAVEARLCLELRYLEAAAVALEQPLEPRILRLLTRLGPRVIETELSGPAPAQAEPAKRSRRTRPPSSPGERDLTEADEPPSAAQSRAHSLRAALNAAKTRDALVLAAIELWLEAFPFAACFAVHRGELRGLIAQEPREPVRDIRMIAIPLDLRSAFSRALGDKDVTIFRPKVSGLEGGVLEDLKRPPGTDVALVPILVRKRPVLLFWLDCAKNTQAVPDSIQMTSVVDLIAQGLERLVIEKRELSRLASLAPKRSSMPPPQVIIAEAPPPPSFAVATPETTGAPLHPSDEAIPESPIDPPPPARRFGPSDLAPGGLEAMLRTAIESPPPPSAGLRTGSSRPPYRDPSAPGTLKGFPRGAAQASSSDVPPRFPESPHPFAPPAFAPLRPRRSVRVDARPSLYPERAVTLGEAPDGPDFTHPIDTIPGLSPLPPPVGLPGSAGPVETIPGLSPDDGPRLSARTMVSSAPLFTAESALDEIPGVDDFDPPPMIPSLRPSQLPPPDEYTAWIADLEGGDESVLEHFVDGGEAAVAALMTAFPGRVQEPRTSTARASECGTIPRVLVHLGRRSVPFLTIRSRDENPVVRRWATFTLGEIPCKDAAEVIATRLFDRVPDVRRAALASARRMNVDPLARRALRASIESAATDRTLDGDARAGAIEALVDIREYESIPTLLTLLEDQDKSVKRAAKWGLTVLLRQDFGTDVAAWRAFWNDHRDEDRVEWLILALDHASVDLRRAASDELTGLSGQRFGFDPHASPTERRVAQAKYREWWAARGQSGL